MEKNIEKKQMDELIQVFHLSQKVRLRYFWLPDRFPKLSQKLWERKHVKAVDR